MQRARRSSRPRGRTRPARRSERRLAWPVRVLVLALVFFAGLALGRALEDGARPSGTQTLVRTLEPTTVVPPRTTTVTVSTP